MPYTEEEIDKLEKKPIDQLTPDEARAIVERRYGTISSSTILFEVNGKRPDGSTYHHTHLDVNGVRCVIGD